MGCSVSKHIVEQSDPLQAEEVCERYISEEDLRNLLDAQIEASNKYHHRNAQGRFMCFSRPSRLGYYTPEEQAKVKLDRELLKNEIKTLDRRIAAVDVAIKNRVLESALDNGKEGWAEILVQRSEVDVGPSKDYLIKSVARGYWNVTQFLLQREEVDINMIGDGGVTALIASLKQGQHGEVAQLLINRSDTGLNHVDDEGGCALGYALAQRSLVVDMLISAGANVDLENRQIADSSYIKLLTSIIEQNNLHDLEQKYIVALDKKVASSKLVNSILRNEIAEVDRLLEIEGLALNIILDGVWTPLSAAVRTGQIGVAQTLLQKGAMVDLGDQVTACSYFIRSLNKIVNMFELGERPDRYKIASDKQLDSMCFINAITSNREDEVKDWLDKSDIMHCNIPDDCGITPFMHVVKLGQIELIKLFIAKGVNLDAKDCKGMVALDCNKSIAVQNALIFAGAKINLTMHSSEYIQYLHYIIESENLHHHPKRLEVAVKKYDRIQLLCEAVLFNKIGDARRVLAESDLNSNMLINMPENQTYRAIPVRRMVGEKLHDADWAKLFVLTGAMINGQNNDQARTDFINKYDLRENLNRHKIYAQVNEFLELYGQSGGNQVEVYFKNLCLNIGVSRAFFFLPTQAKQEIFDLSCSVMLRGMPELTTILDVGGMSKFAKTLDLLSDPKILEEQLNYLQISGGTRHYVSMKKSELASIRDGFRGPVTDTISYYIPATIQASYEEYLFEKPITEEVNSEIISNALKIHHKQSGYMPQIVPEVQVKAREQAKLVLDEMLNVSKVPVRFARELDRGVQSDVVIL